MDLLELLKQKRFEELRERIAATEDAVLLSTWIVHEPLHKAALFKLMPRARAFSFYRQLPFGEQYFLVMAAPAGTIAPLVEDASPEIRGLFHRLSPDDVNALADIAIAVAR